MTFEKCLPCPTCEHMLLNGIISAAVRIYKVHGRASLPAIPFLPCWGACLSKTEMAKSFSCKQVANLTIGC